MKAVVIGSGFGGVSAALILQAKGYETTLVEKLDVLGGRGRPYMYDGYDFEAGPTVITAPSLLEELYEEANLNFHEEVELLETTPFYELYFADGSRMKYFGEKELLEQEIKKINPDDFPAYERFYKLSTKIYQKGFVELVKNPFLSNLDFLKQLPNLIRLQAQRSVYGIAKSMFKDERLRKTFSFHTLLIGGNPATTTSIYALIHALERKEGVWYVKGGTHQMVNNIAENFEKKGGVLRKGIGVTEIIVSNPGSSNQKVTGVKLEDGTLLDADIVVSNADVTRTYTRFLADNVKKDYTKKWFAKKKYTPGLFVTYFVTNKEYPELSHHSIVFCERYTDLLKDIFQPNNILTEDISLYLHANKRSDPDRAPDGKEMFYVLSVVPNLKSGTDWDAIKEEYERKVLEELDGRVIPDLFKNLDFAVSFSPKDFDTVLQSEHGSFASLQPTLFQSGPFRPHNKSHKINGLYFAGAGTQPGAGVPGVISSGMATAELIQKENPLK